MLHNSGDPFDAGLISVDFSSTRPDSVLVLVADRLNASSRAAFFPSIFFFYVPVKLPGHGFVISSIMKFDPLLDCLKKETVSGTLD
jgi:hypothetical protein